MKFRSVDVGFPGKSPLDAMRLARRAEELGFGCVWLQEGGGWGAVPLASSILTSTSRIRVGTGIVSPFLRHPQVLAEDAATLSEQSRGRFILGIGSGPYQLQTLGIRTSQLTGLRESVEIIRRLLRGERFEYPGKVFRFEQPTALSVKVTSPPPIHIGALLPRMVSLAAEVSDGLLVSRRGGSSPRYVRALVEQVDRERRGASNPKNFAVRPFIESFIDTDREKAYRASRRVLATYTIPLMPEKVRKKTGLRLKELGAVSKLKGEEAEKEVSDGLVRELSMSGTPEDCLKKLEAFKGLDLEAPILYLHGPSTEKALELAGEKILPHLTG